MYSYVSFQAMSEARSLDIEINSTSSRCDQVYALTCCTFTPADEALYLLVSYVRAAGLSNDAWVSLTGLGIAFGFLTK